MLSAEFLSPSPATLSPPRLPSDTAAGSFPSCSGVGMASDACPVARSVISFASWFASRGRLGFLERSTKRCNMARHPADASPGARRKIVKLTHYRHFASLAMADFPHLKLTIAS